MQRRSNIYKLETDWLVKSDNDKTAHIGWDILLLNLVTSDTDSKLWCRCSEKILHQM